MKNLSKKLSVAGVLALILSPALALAHPTPTAAHKDHSSRPHLYEVSLHH